MDFLAYVLLPLLPLAALLLLLAPRRGKLKPTSSADLQVPAEVKEEIRADQAHAEKEAEHARDVRVGAQVVELREKVSELESVEDVLVFVKDTSKGVHTDVPDNPRPPTLH